MLSMCHWYNAITLTERIASLRPLRGHTPNVDVNVDLAGRRLQRWRSQPPFTAGSYFDQRLAMDGTSEDELHYLLGEPIEAVRDRFPVPPAWLVQLAQKLSRPCSDPTSLSETVRH